MFAHRILIGLSAGVVLCGLLILLPLLRGNADVPEELLQEMVYVDSQTGETYLLRARSSPETNPDTGEPTLVPGLYCEKCKAWRAVGTMEMLQTGQVPQTCPIHKIRLNQDGPLPEFTE